MHRIEAERGADASPALVIACLVGNAPGTHTAYSGQKCTLQYLHQFDSHDCTQPTSVPSPRCKRNAHRSPIGKERPCRMRISRVPCCNSHQLGRPRRQWYLPGSSRNPRLQRLRSDADAPSPDEPLRGLFLKDVTLLYTLLCLSCAASRWHNSPSATTYLPQMDPTVA